MKRDARLHGLSSEHHGALVLARSLDRAHAAWTREDGEAFGRRFDRELEPHFRVEEELLLPALVGAGAQAIAARVADDHARLREGAAAVRAGDGGAARAFAERLREHVRFEERELFPACEELLAGETLDEVARRAPKAPG